MTLRPFLIFFLITCVLIIKSNAQGRGEFSPNSNTENNEVRLDTDIDSKTALSIVKKIEYNQNLNRSLLSIQIETGRKHQIRKHLSEFGFPIHGDRLYGDAKANDEDLQLSSVFLSFPCPMYNKNQTYILPDELHPHF